MRVLLVALALAAVDPHAPQHRFTAADTRKAHAIALRRSDLAAGWTVQKPQKPGPPCSVEPDEHTLVQTARIDPTFAYKDGVTTVGSEVDIFRTAREAQRDWNVSTLHVISTCVLESARQGLSKGETANLVSAKKLAAPTLSDRGLHYRLVLTLHAKRNVKLVADLVALSRGRATVALHTLSIGTPLPANAESVLVGVLARRLNGGRGSI